MSIQSLRTKAFKEAQTFLKSLNFNRITDPNEHKKYHNNQLEPTDKLFRLLHFNYHQRYVIPTTTKNAENDGILKDSVFEFNPKVLVDVDFKGLRKGAYGQYVTPFDAAFSPTIRLHSKEPKQYVTIMLSDLDSPCLESKLIEEWCHWLITDIPLDQFIEINGGSSPYLKNPEAIGLKVPNHQPTVGNVVFDYVPPHPALSNPKRQHRYVLTVWKQPKPEIKLDFTSVGNNDVVDNSLPPHQRSHYGDSDIKFHKRKISTSLKFAAKNGLDLVGMGYFKSAHSIESSKIMQSLGIHEPVYGKIRNGSESTLLSKVILTTELASQLSDNPTSHDLNLLNKGQKIFKKPILIPTLNELKSKDNKFKKYEIQNNTKRPNILAQVGIVKNREGDIAKGFQGAIAKKLLTRRNRFENA